MDFKDIILSEGRLSPKCIYYRSIYITPKITDMENKLSEVKDGCWRGNGGYGCDSTEVAWGKSLWWWKILHPDWWQNYAFNKITWKHSHTFHQNKFLVLLLYYNYIRFHYGGNWVKNIQDFFVWYYLSKIPKKKKKGFKTCRL